jgi:hypothetical protein
MWQPPSPTEQLKAKSTRQIRPSAGLEDDDAKYTHSTSNSRHTRPNGQIPCPRIEQRLWPSNRNPLRNDRPSTSASLHPVHLAKVSKSHKKKKTQPQPQPIISPKALFSGLPLSASVDAAKPRRSKRIKNRQVPSVVIVPARMGFAKSAGSRISQHPKEELAEG